VAREGDGAMSTVAASAAPARVRESGAAARSVTALARVPAVAWVVVLALALLVAYGLPGTGYDAWWSLEWGRELAHGGAPDLTAAWAPTPHPLAIALAVPLSLLGGAAPTVAAILSLLALASVGVTAALLGHRLFGPVAGALAAAILLTRPLLVGAALDTSVDVGFLALVLGAGAVLARGGDQDRRRRALLLLLAAGLLRPEAWALALALAAWSRTPRALALALAAPLAWTLFDLLATGDPLHSLHGTRDLAQALGRPGSPATALRVAPDHLTAVLGSAVALAGGAAAIAAVWLAPRRAALPLAVLGVGLAGFLALGLAGLPLLYRYTLLPAAALVLLAAWGTQAALSTRRTRPIGVALAVVLLAGLLGARHDLARQADQAHAARAEQRDLAALLDAVAPRLSACGGARVTYQRPVPEIAYLTGRAPTASGRAVTLAPAYGTRAFADRLAPTDGPASPTNDPTPTVRGAWTASSDC
jgi:hypothetical protein